MFRFSVIEGGRADASDEKQSAETQPEPIRAEGLRRLRDAGYPRLEARERLTGAPVPSRLAYYRLQVEFAISALSTLMPIPVDYADDAYWPSFEG